MKKTHFTRRRNLFRALLFLTSAWALAACGGAPPSSGTTGAQDAPETASQTDTPPPVAAAPADDPTVSVDESTTEAPAPAAPASEGTLATASVSTPDNEPAQQEFSAAEKPIEQQISETKEDVTATRKTLAKSDKALKAAETRLRLADKARTKAAESNAKNAEVLAAATEKQQMVLEQLNEANRILGLANDALAELKAKTPEKYKDKLDVEDSIKSQKQFVGEKSALVRKKTEALNKEDKTVAVARAKADKSAERAKETQLEYDEALKVSTTEKETVAGTEARLAALTAHLDELTANKKGAASPDR